MGVVKLIRPNIGIVNALIRITCGLTILAWSTSKSCKKPWRDCYFILIVIGAMKVGEGILRFCPFIYLVQNAKMPFLKDEGNLEEDDEKIVFNPS